jgi:ATP-dependent Clp protease, protease subunit
MLYYCYTAPFFICRFLLNAPTKEQRKGFAPGSSETNPDVSTAAGHCAEAKDRGGSSGLEQDHLCTRSHPRDAQEGWNQIEGAAAAVSDPTEEPYLSGIIPEIFYINYSDTISDSKVRGLMALCSEILAKVTPTPGTLYFAFSSKGGDVVAGVTLYNFLRALPLQVVMHNIGSVDSIATAIFLAGSVRYACQHSRFLFHGISWTFAQNQALTPSQVREILSGLEQNEDLIRELVVQRSRLGDAEMRTLLQQGETKDPAFALQKGIIDEIRDFSLPIGAKIVTANFQ